MHRTAGWAALAAVGMLAGAWRGTAATTYYVATSGSDSADGTSSWNTAYLTISNAVAKAQNTDTVLVSNGTYALTATVLVTNQITLRSWNTGALDTAGTVLDGQGTVRCLFVSNYSLGGIKIYGLTLSNGNARASGAMGGGGLYSWGGTIISNCLITRNVASNGGGAYLWCYANYGAYWPTLIDSTISANTVYPNTNNQWQGGGGLYLAGGITRVTGCLISNNWLIGERNSALWQNTTLVGGGIMFLTGGPVSNCVIVNNVNPNGTGGAGGGYGITITHSTIRNNSARQGGGVYGKNANFPGKLYHCLVEYNAATNECGGVGDESSPTAGMSVMRNCLVRYNTAWGVTATWGGYDYPSGGGGVMGHQGVQVESCTIASNYATRGGGGALFTWTPFAAYTGKVFNSISYGNGAAAGGSNWHHHYTLGAMQYSNSCTAPDVSAFGANNQSNNPLFADAAAGDFRLNPLSPCVDAGFVQSWMTNAFDYGGRRRIINERVDMGAYELLPQGTLFKMR